MSWCQQEAKDYSTADYLNQHVKQLKVMLMPSDHFLDESFSVAVFSRQLSSLYANFSTVFLAVHEERWEALLL